MVEIHFIALLMEAANNLKEFFFGGTGQVMAGFHPRPEDVYFKE